MPDVHVETQGGLVFQGPLGNYVGGDQIILTKDYSGEQLEQVLYQVRAMLATGQATLQANLNQGWGEFERDNRKTKIRVIYGNLRLSILDLPYISHEATITVAGKRVNFTQNDGMFGFEDSVILSEGSEMIIAT